MSRVLIAEDEHRIASFVEKGLQANGFATIVATTGPEALAIARRGQVDLVILDVGLPELDGFQVLERLRGSGSRIPIVMLTARDGVADTVAGFEGGADDYVTKPFRFEELLARVRARLREESAPVEAELTVADAVLDLRTRQVRVGGDAIDLSAREFALAELFFRHPGQVLSREQILNQVWGYDFDPGSNVVDVYVGYLRRKIGSGRIASVRRMGYRLER